MCLIKIIINIIIVFRMLIYYDLIQLYRRVNVTHIQHIIVNIIYYNFDLLLILLLALLFRNILKLYAGQSSTAVGARLNAEWIYQWLKDPQKLRPGTIEPNRDMSDDDARALTAFLMAQKGAGSKKGATKTASLRKSGTKGAGE